MKYLICNVNLFNYNQNIYIANEDGQLDLIADCPSPESLIKLIPYYCQENDINVVQLVGPEAYLEGIKENILTYIKQEYSNLNLEIDCMETLE